MGSRKQEMFYLKNISAKGAEFPNVYQLEVNSGVYVGAIKDFTEALDKALIETIGRDYADVDVNALGRLYTVVYRGKPVQQFAHILVEVAKATFVAPPELEFAVMDSPDVRVGQRHVVVFYRGTVDPNFLSLPGNSANLWTSHNGSDKSVTVMSDNPLYPITDELVEQVQAALRAASVPVK